MTGCLCLVIMYSICEYYDIYLTFGQCIGNALNYQGTSYFFFLHFSQKLCDNFSKTVIQHSLCGGMQTQCIWLFSMPTTIAACIHRDGVEGIQGNMPYAFCILFVALAGVYTLPTVYSLFFFYDYATLYTYIILLVKRFEIFILMSTL